MKKLIFFFLAFALVGSCYAQKISASKVPAPVTAAFKKQYPDVKSVTWEMEDGNYEANFKQKGTETSAVFDKNGAQLESEIEIKSSQLPAQATTYLKSHYKSGVKEAAKITKTNGEVNYEAVVGGKELIFDSNGKYLMEKEEKEPKGKKQ